LATCATRRGSSPFVLAPSESSTIAPGSRLGRPSLSMTGARIALMPMRRPSPIDVPPSTCRPSSARSTWERSVVGSDTCSTRVLKLITPSRNSSGSELTSVRAASRAALKRSGATSVACMEPDVSCTSMTVPWRCSTATVRSGRASASPSAASASTASSAGTCRPRAFPATPASTSTAG
jgi:hypothetical protein